MVNALFRQLQPWLKEERRALVQPHWRTTLVVTGLLLTTLLGVEATRRYQGTRLRLQQDQEQAIGVLQAIIRQARLTAQDWAHWDDALDFIEGRNPQFPEADMGTTSLLDDGAVMMIYGPAGTRLAAAGATDAERAISSELSRCIAAIDRQRRKTSEDHLAALCTGSDQLYVGTIESITNSTGSRKSGASLAFLSPVLSQPGQRALTRNLGTLHAQLIDQLEQPRTGAETEPILPPLWTHGARMVNRPALAIQTPLIHEWAALALLTGSLSLSALGLRMRWLLMGRRQRLEQRRSEQVYQRRIRQMERDVEQLLDQTQRSARPDAMGAFARLLEQQDAGRSTRSGRSSEDRLANRIEEILNSARSLVLLDGLTGLPNRNFFLEQLEWESEQCRQTATPVALLFINIDQFKTINETYGHSVGDAALRHVGDELQKLIADNDFLARFGGDEFSLIINSASLRGLSEDGIRQHIHHKASEILREFNSHANNQPQRLKLSLSIGIALSDPRSTTPEEMIRRSDMAMVIAKKRNSSPISIFDISCATDELNGYRMFNALQADINEAPERFTILFQPIVNHSGAMFELEALVRWHNPDYSDVSPDLFIAIAERYRLIGDLGELIIHRTLADFKPIQEQHISDGASPLSLAINISPSQLMRHGFGPWLLKQLRIYHIAPEDITVEVTESAMMEASEELNDNLESLRQAGVKLALDDFGTGYSSLRLLMWLRPNELKIDKSFVMATAHDPLAQQIVRLLQQLSSAMNLRLVAEGVEDEEIRDRLLQVGITHFQGFLYSRPQPPGQLLNGPPPRAESLPRSGPRSRDGAP